MDAPAANMLLRCGNLKIEFANRLSLEMALFAKHELVPDMLKALATIADQRHRPQNRRGPSP